MIELQNLAMSYAIENGTLFIEDLYSLNGTFLKLRDEVRLTPEAARARLTALGYADPGGAHARAVHVQHLRLGLDHGALRVG